MTPVGSFHGSNRLTWSRSGRAGSSPNRRTTASAADGSTVLSAVSAWTLLFAWGYVAARIVQSAVHLSYNNPAHRGGAFVLGVVFSLALWVNIALVIFARV